jgi:hypothetical protein
MEGKLMDAADRYGFNQHNKKIRAIGNAIKAVDKAMQACSYSIFLNSAKNSLVNALLEQQVMWQKMEEVRIMEKNDQRNSTPNNV